ncbi:MAG: DUF1631 domain-containing protein [Gammaproteobacteria bacterium]|nr:DUF1631 domain-containing protein [Gammaproteobacteria bacterium]
MNIVQLNEYEKARGGISRQEAVGLLRECREVVTRTLSASLVRMMGKVDDALFELAEKAESNAVQSLYFDAMREVRLKRASMEIGFKAQLIEGFNREIRKENDTAEPATLMSNPRMEELDLVEHDALEETLAVSNMVSKIAISCKEEVGLLNRRIGYLLNDPELLRAKNPIGPEVVCNAFREACGDVESGIKVKLIIMKLFDRYVATEEMQALYRDINKLLIDKGVLPELRHEVRRTGATRARANVAGTGTAEAAQDPQNIIDEDVFATLQQLMQRGISGGLPGGMTSGIMLGGGVGHATGGTGGGNPGFMNTLTLLQQGNSELVAGGVANLSNADLMSGSVNVIRNIQSSGIVGNVGAVDGMVIDVVAMLFDFILDDENIPPAMQALIGRLQIPMLKVAMLDKSFFSRKSHPARKLLNVLAEASVGWNGEQDQALYKQVDGVVKRVLVEFENNVGLFAELLGEFEQYLAKEREKAELHEEQSARMVQGKERLREAKQKVRIEVDRRCHNDLPKFVRQFLVSYWQNLLLVTLIKEGAESIAWKRSLTTMDNLVWSLQSKNSMTERDRLVKLLPSLLRTLREGMVLISMREDDFQSFLEQLASCHAGIVNAVPREIDAANDAGHTPMMADDPLADIVEKTDVDSSEPVEEDRAVTTATLHRLAEDGAIDVEEITLAVTEEAPQELENDAFMEQVRELKQGAWVEFTQDDGSSLRAKLTWISPVTGVYLFTNRQGLKACDRTLPGLAADLRRGSARVLDDAPVFERAVSNMIDGLRKQAS